MSDFKEKSAAEIRRADRVSSAKSWCCTDESADWSGAHDEEKHRERALKADY
jgi:hypothetical protein